MVYNTLGMISMNSIILYNQKISSTHIALHGYPVSDIRLLPFAKCRKWQPWSECGGRRQPRNITTNQGVAELELKRSLLLCPKMSDGYWQREIDRERQRNWNSRLTRVLWAKICCVWKASDELKGKFEQSVCQILPYEWSIKYFS